MRIRTIGRAAAFAVGLVAAPVLATDASAASLKDLLGGQTGLQAYSNGNGVRVRNLATGDDWKVFSRTDRFYIKQYEAETNLACNFLLDSSMSMFFASEPAAMSKFAYAATMAAALAYLLMKQKDAFGLALFDDDLRTLLPAKSSGSHFRLIINALQEAEPGGQTDGVKPIANNVLFERFVQEFTQVIRAKREGIFEIDLRLRPFGKDGPLACTLDNFDRYFRADATDRQSHPMERLALVRMRRFAGDRALGEHVEQLRDRHVYDPGEIELEALRELRRKAYREKATGGTFNAKRGCGGLIDLEVAVQTLQVMHAANHAAVRTPFIHEALTALAETGVIDDDEHEAVVSAYEFLRQLINGLRMERGSAIDLFMPTRDTQEYLHLARRVEYEHTHGLDVGEQLQIDLQHATATVRAFVERHFSREALPDPDIANIADVVLSDDVGATWRNEVLSGIGLKDLRAADSLLRGMAGAGGRRRVFARLALLAVHLMPAADAVDRDHLLRRWTRWVSRLSDPQQQFAAQLDAPITLRILLGLLGGSDAAASVLIRVPELLIWATRPERILRPQQLKALDDALRDAAKDHTVGN